MNRIRKALFSFPAAAAVVLCCWGAAQPGLSRTNRIIIQVAYMNGYVAAVREDTEQIRKLREDPELMREVVEQAAAEYVQRVYDMNKD